jgi:hypothetical protein
MMHGHGHDHNTVPVIDNRIEAKPFISEEKSPWKKYWRPAAAFIYLIIVMFDFLIMPVIFEYHDAFDPSEVIENVVKFEKSEVQIVALNKFTEKRTWSPLTILGGGMFHLSFGAILGLAAWTRGQEKVALAKNSIRLE